MQVGDVVGGLSMELDGVLVFGKMVGHERTVPFRFLITCLSNFSAKLCHFANPPCDRSGYT